MTAVPEPPTDRVLTPESPPRNWIAELLNAFLGVRGIGLWLALFGGAMVALSLTAELSSFVTANGLGTGRNVRSLVADGTLTAQLIAALICPLLLLASRRTLARVLAAVCGVAACVATTVACRDFVECFDKPAPGGVDVFRAATYVVAIGACVCLVRPREWASDRPRGGTSEVP
jgi:hypothetical protein